MLRVAVDIGGRARVICEVARTAAEQARGLQDHLELRDGTGMLFPFYPPRAATFHMGRVAFPIDLLFTDASGTIRRLVLGASVGSRSVWSHPVVGAVVEVPGGYVTRQGITIGDRVAVAGRKIGAQTYNLLRTLTEASTTDAGALDEPRGPEGPFDVHAVPPPLRDGYYSKEPQHTPPNFGGERDRLTAPQRWNDRTLLDIGPDSMPQPNAHWEQGIGYVRPLADDAVYPLRPSASASASVSATVRVDLTTLIPHVVVGALREGIAWEPLVLNEFSERAIITPSAIGGWLHALGLGEREREHVFNAVVSNEGLEVLADALLLEGIASAANISHLGDQNILVLTRRK